MFVSMPECVCVCVVDVREVERGLAAARVHSKEGVHEVANLIKKKTETKECYSLSSRVNAMFL